MERLPVKVIALFFYTGHFHRIHLTMFQLPVGHAFGAFAHIYSSEYKCAVSICKRGI
jgi:hypothetical protein